MHLRGDRDGHRIPITPQHSHQMDDRNYRMAREFSNGQQLINDSLSIHDRQYGDNQ